VLVAWQPAWVPICYLHEPLRSQWQSMPKWVASAGIGGLFMNVQLPVKPDSSLAKDVQILTSRAHQLDIRQFLTPNHRLTQNDR
jgi:hypothetical protein